MIENNEKLGSFDLSTLELLRDESLKKSKEYDCPIKAQPFFELSLAIAEVLKSGLFKKYLLIPAVGHLKSVEQKTS